MGKKDRRGFTLIELAVGMLFLGMVVTMVFQGVALAAKARVRTSEGSDTARTAVVLEMLARDLARLDPERGQVEARGETLTLTGFRAGGKTVGWEAHPRQDGLTELRRNGQLQLEVGSVSFTMFRQGRPVFLLFELEVQGLEGRRPSAVSRLYPIER